MVHVNLSITVGAESTALKIVEVCRDSGYKSAALSYLGFLGGGFHEARGVIACTAENEAAARAAWAAFVDNMHRAGFSRCIY